MTLMHLMPGMHRTGLLTRFTDGAVYARDSAAWMLYSRGPFGLYGPTFSGGYVVG